VKEGIRWCRQNGGSWVINRNRGENFPGFVREILDFRGPSASLPLSLSL